MATTRTTLNYDSNENKSYTTSYHRRPIEQVILNLIFDAFVAPIIAFAQTFLTICFHLTIFFTLPLTVSMIADVLSYTNETPLVFVSLITTSTILLFTYGGYIFQHASIGLARCTAVVSIITTLVSVFLVPSVNTNLYAIGISSGAGACIGALLYWAYLEPRQKTLSFLLCHHYGRVATIKAAENKTIKTAESVSTTVKDNLTDN